MVRRIAIISMLPALGAAWGMALGMWALGPWLVEVHRIAPTTPAQWCVLVVSILTASALIGAALSPFAAIPLVLWPLVRRRPYRSAGWAGMLFIAPALVVTYLGAALFIEWRFFDRFPLRPDRHVLQWAVVAVVVTGLVGACYRRAERVPARASRVLGSLAIAAALGAAVLPYRVTRDAVAGISDETRLVATGPRAADAPPLLLVGIDSGNWDTLRPLLERHELPTFERLLADGIHGDVDALWPPYWSGAAWAALLTGHPREETGVYGDLIVTAPGLPTYDAPWAPTDTLLLDPYLAIEWRLLEAGVIEASTPPRSALGRRPVWELLTDAGVHAGVVRFDFTYPPTGQADVVVSNHAGHDTWQLAHVTVGGDVVAPAALQRELLAPFAPELPFDEAGFARIVPPARTRRAARVQFELDAVRTAYDIDRRTLAAADVVRRLRPDLDVLAVYLGGFDNVCHSLWAYRFPDAYGAARPAAADVAELGPALDRYLVFLDDALGRLLATYRRAPNVIVVSDHGHEAVLDHPLWRGWHGRWGVFLAHGPSIPARAEPVSLSYYDLVPTVAQLVGLAPATPMHGASVLPASDAVGRP
jgi:hypothetical protein